jgi:hypothetical protein
MVSIKEIRSIISQYGKHGWTLRRILSTSGSETDLSKEFLTFDPQIIFGNSSINGLWFSRPSKADSVAWELRRTTGTPYALVTVIDEEVDEETMEEELQRVELEMAESMMRSPKVGNLN